MNENRVEILTLLEAVFKNAEGNKINLANLPAKLKEIRPEFSHHEYGYERLKQLLEDFPSRITLTRDGTNPLTVYAQYISDEDGEMVKSMSSTAETVERKTKGRVSRYDDQRGFGFIVPKTESPDVFVHYSGLDRSCKYDLSIGDLVEYYVRPGKEGPEACQVNVTGWSKPFDHLAAFADMGPTTINYWAYLAEELAEREPWDYTKTKSSESYPILRNYIRFTFQRLEEMPAGISISKDGKAASFNTGLVTNNQEEIYATFVQNPRPLRQPWKFDGFKKASDRVFVDKFGAASPPLADYFNDPSVLLYDKRCPLIINIDHVMQNLDRFPEHLRSNPYVARQLLSSAQASTQKRVYRNYKAAIPQYFRDKGGAGVLQLLLPICLEQPGVADLALAVEKTESGDAYLGSTVLTLDMAYNNARLLARPDTEWLQP